MKKWILKKHKKTFLEYRLEHGKKIFLLGKYSNINILDAIFQEHYDRKTQNIVSLEEEKEIPIVTDEKSWDEYSDDELQQIHKALLTFDEEMSKHFIDRENKFEILAFIYQYLLFSVDYYDLEEHAKFKEYDDIYLLSQNNNLYSALVEGYSSSFGICEALKLLCNFYDIACDVVSVNDKENDYINKVYFENGDISYLSLADEKGKKDAYFSYTSSKMIPREEPLRKKDLSYDYFLIDKNHLPLTKETLRTILKKGIFFPMSWKKKLFAKINQDQPIQKGKEQERKLQIRRSNTLVSKKEKQIPSKKKEFQTWLTEKIEQWKRESVHKKEVKKQEREEQRQKRKQIQAVREEQKRIRRNEKSAQRETLKKKQLEKKRLEQERKRKLQQEKEERRKRQEEQKREYRVQMQLEKERQKEEQKRQKELQRIQKQKMEEEKKRRLEEELKRQLEQKRKLEEALEQKRKEQLEQEKKQQELLQKNKETKNAKVKFVPLNEQKPKEELNTKEKTSFLPKRQEKPNLEKTEKEESKEKDHLLPATYEIKQKEKKQEERPKESHRIVIQETPKKRKKIHFLRPLFYLAVAHTITNLVIYPKLIEMTLPNRRILTNTLENEKVKKLVRK